MMTKEVKLKLLSRIDQFLYKVGELKGYTSAVSTTAGRNLELIDDLDSDISELRKDITSIIEELDEVKVNDVLVESNEDELSDTEYSELQSGQDLDLEDTVS